MSTEITLTAGKKYDVTCLVLDHWTSPAGETLCFEGGSYLDWFRDGEYLGPDCDGVEPVFNSNSVQESVIAEYKLESCKKNKTVIGTLPQARVAAIEMEEDLQPSFGVQIIDESGETVADIRDGIDTLSESMCE